MNHTKEQARLGWLPAAMPVLFVALFSSANAMGSALTADPIRNFDSVIQQNESDAAQILSTLGRDKKPDSQTSSATRKKLRVQLLPAKKTAKGGKARRA
ncbi:MAG: hypothetical protein KF799_09305 [Bdellovibrionales bacterium]|nr:hypothetical protein [Bdellovibrionales bacterium]